ncbi:unnamed protein product [Staurois parvus]|uniref:Uncharacterized protein n=1 Tax=Staurois parvus TaxID=386267 RepID=A0ABN9D088_9NEOB|nr:unnamed protein product [Staurois parvus]
MGPCTDSSCCCQARNLSWAPVPPPHAAARSRVCHGSLYGSHCCCLYRHTLHVPLSGLLTLLVVSIFVIGCVWPPLLLPPPPHCGSTLWFWPVTAQMSECAVILRSTAFHSACILMTVFLLFPSRLQGHIN